MPFNFSAPVDWVNYNSGHTGVIYPEIRCYKKSSEQHKLLIRRLHGQMKDGKSPDPHSYQGASGSFDDASAIGFDFDEVHKIKDFSPDFVRAYYPSLKAIIADFQVCMQEAQQTECADGATCKIVGYTYMGYLPDLNQYKDGDVPAPDTKCTSHSEFAANECPDPLWNVVRPKSAPPPLPARKPAFELSSLPVQKPNSTGEKTQLVVLGEVGLMAQPDFREAWTNAFRIRLSDHYDVMATHAEDAALFGLMGSVVAAIGERGPRKLQDLLNASNLDDVLVPTLQEGRRVMLDDPDLTDPEVVFLRSLESLVSIVAGTLAEEGFDDLAKKVSASGLSAFAVRQSGGLVLELSWQSGTIGSIAYLAYRDAVEKTKSSQIPLSIIDVIEDRILPNCRGGRASIPGHAIYSSHPDIVSVRLGLVECDWLPYTEPCTYRLGCDVMRFKLTGNGWLSQPKLNSDKIGDAMMIGRTRPHNKPVVPPPPQVANDPRYLEIYGLKEALPGTGAQLDAN
ncbi:hypothetical protein KUV57_12855 [Epibacterium sp. DP7N7-1]|nr:hypothetical protein [Epibacterium sp. DP7N7-1]